MSSSTTMVSSSGSRDSIKFARDARDALRSIGKNESIEGVRRGEWSRQPWSFGSRSKRRPITMG